MIMFMKITIMWERGNDRNENISMKKCAEIITVKSDETENGSFFKVRNLGWVQKFLTSHVMHVIRRKS
jgi:hypothetical protein